MKNKIYIDGEEVSLTQEAVDQLNIVQTADNQFHVLKAEKAFKVKLLELDANKRKVLLEVNGNKYEVKVDDEYDQLVKKMGLSTGGKQKLKNIKAPMPGLILDILIEAGQEVAKGDQLLVLEAMKMENVLKADGEGVIKSIEVDKGAAVEKGQIIIEME